MFPETSWSVRPGRVYLAGWAALARGTADVRVQIRINGLCVRSGLAAGERPDVMQTFGAYCRSGWAFEFEGTPAMSGSTIEIVAVSEGSAQVSGPTVVRVLPEELALPRMTSGRREQPRAGQVLPGEVVRVEGWVSSMDVRAVRVEIVVGDNPPVRIRRCEPLSVVNRLDDTGTSIDIGAGFSDLVPLRGKHSWSRVAQPRANIQRPDHDLWFLRTMGPRDARQIWLWRVALGSREGSLRPGRGRVVARVGR